MIEKPSKEDLLHRAWGIIGRYILTPDIFDIEEEHHQVKMVNYKLQML